MNYLFRTFDPIVRTIYYECGGKRITEKEIHPFRISFPAHTFVMCFSDYNKELRGYAVDHRLFFHHPGEKNYSLPYLPNINPGGNVCLSETDNGWNISLKPPAENDLIAAINRFWSSSFNGSWSGSLHHYEGIFFSRFPLSCKNKLEILQQESESSKYFWKGRLVPVPNARSVPEILVG